MWKWLGCRQGREMSTGGSVGLDTGMILGDFRSISTIHAQDGDFLIGNMVTGNKGYLIKFDSSGNHLWNSYISSIGGDSIYRVEADASDAYISGNYASAATIFATNGEFSLVHTASSQDAFISKLDTSGNYVWSVVVAGNGFDQLL